jgi:hypothetical protein
VNLLAKQQTNSIALILLVLLLLAGVWYFQRAPPALPPSENVTAPPEPGVEEGDLVAINFILLLPNGTVVDTNNETLAERYGITNYVKGPFRFVVGQSGKVKGFDGAVLGMKLGETRTKVIEPSEPMLQFTLNRTRTNARNQPVPLFAPISLKKFEASFKRKPVLNDLVYTPDLPWPIKVVNITEKYVVAEAMTIEGKSYTLPGLEWESLLLVKSRNDMLFRHNPKEGQVITTDFGPAVISLAEGTITITSMAQPDDVVTYSVPLEGGPATIPYRFQVTNVTNTEFTIRRIDYLPQEALVLTAELTEWEQDVQKLKQSPAQES